MSYLLRNSDFAQTPLKNAVLDRRTTDPDHAVEGQVIFNTTDKEARIFKDGVWSELGGGGGLPIGGICMWLLGTVPDGCLTLSGQVVNIADYPLLFALWGAAYGGNGTTTFGIPDWREYSPVGMSAAAPYNTLNAAIGAKTSTGLIAHTHTVNHDHGPITSGAEATHTHSAAHGHIATTSGAGSSHTHSIAHDHAAATSGVGSSHTHSIAHDHAAVTSGAGSSHNHTFTGATTGNDNTEHTHSGTTSTVSADHSHGVSGTTGGGGTHSHGVHYKQSASGSGSNLIFLRRNDAADSYDGTDTDAAIGVGDHTHAFSVQSGGISANHTHTITTGGRSAYHQHTTSGSNAAEAAHTHSVDLPNFTGNAVAEAAHTHSVDLPSFTGNAVAEAAHTHSTTIASAALTTAAGSSHTHAVDVAAFTGASGSAGSGTSFGILDPKRVCHFIVRGR